MAKSRGSGSPRRPEPEFLVVGRVLRPWGVRGETKIEVLSSHPEDLAAGQRVYLGEDVRPFDVQHARRRGDSLIVKLAGCDTPEQADALRGQVVRIALAAATPLRPNEYYRRQIVGLSVVTLDGDELGTLVDILETGAHDVYVVHGPRGEVLLPARVEFVKRVDLAAGRMWVSLLPGMLPE